MAGLRYLRPSDTASHFRTAPEPDHRRNPAMIPHACFRAGFLSAFLA
jgi:hypothetical protein